MLFLYVFYSVHVEAVFDRIPTLPVVERSGVGCHMCPQLAVNAVRIDTTEPLRAEVREIQAVGLPEACHTDVVRRVAAGHPDTVYGVLVTDGTLICRIRCLEYVQNTKAGVTPRAHVTTGTGKTDPFGHPASTEFEIHTGCLRAWCFIRTCHTAGKTHAITVAHVHHCAFDLRRFVYGTMW
jgi:hypothetical protein